MKTVAYLFTGNSVEGCAIKPVILDILAALKNIGISVAMITADMGPNNRFCCYCCNGNQDCRQ